MLNRPALFGDADCLVRAHTIPRVVVEHALVCQSNCICFFFWTCQPDRSLTGVLEVQTGQATFFSVWATSLSQNVRCDVTSTSHLLPFRFLTQNCCETPKAHKSLRRCLLSRWPSVPATQSPRFRRPHLRPWCVRIHVAAAMCPLPDS
jgi:hypothetical protein